MVITGYPATSFQHDRVVCQHRMSGRRHHHEGLSPHAAAHQRVVDRLGAKRPQGDGRAPLGQAVLDDLDVAVSTASSSSGLASRSFRRTPAGNSELAAGETRDGQLPVIVPA